MASENDNQEYRFEDDTVKQSAFKFGLNAGVAFLKKFEWIPNGGINGAEQEALDIIFTINGQDKGYRQFPVTQAFNKQGQVITDVNSPEVKEARADFNKRMVHILHSFHPTEVVKAGMAAPIRSFKDMCNICKSLLPQNFATKALDIFLQYQFNIKGTATQTYLEIPKSMKYGYWLTPKQDGTWKEVRIENPPDNEQKALTYVNETGAIHPISKTGWFVNSNFSKWQKEGGVDNNTNNATGHNTGGGGTGGDVAPAQQPAQPSSATTSNAPAAAW